MNLFRIPGTYERRVAWLREIEKYFPNLKTPERCKVCSDHFHSDSFRTDSKNRTLLKRNAVPTIFQVWVGCYFVSCHNCFIEDVIQAKIYLQIEDYGLPWRRIKKLKSKLKQSETDKKQLSHLQIKEKDESSKNAFCVKSSFFMESPSKREGNKTK